MVQKIPRRCGAALLVSWLLLAQAAGQATEFRIGTLALAQPWARATAPGATVGAVYFALSNSGGTADRLLSLSSPIAKQVQIHAMRMVNGTMEMRALDGVECPPGITVNIEPGSLHVMLLGLQHQLLAGTQFPLSLHFRDAGVLTVQVAVRAPE